jgi:hypothetical protein
MRFATISLCFAVLLPAVGCSKPGPPKFPVSGKVSFKGQPLKEGMVTFYTKDDGAYAATIDASGTFVIDKGLKEGQYRVYVEPPPEVMTPPPRGGPPNTPPKVYENVPQKYRQAATSGLLATVEPKTSGNKFEFDLKP